MLRRAVAAGSHVDLGWMSPGKSHEFGKAFDRKGRVDDQDIWHAHEPGDRCDVASKVVVEVVIQGRVDSVGGADQQKGMTITVRTGGHLGGDGAAGPGPVV